MPFNASNKQDYYELLEVSESATLEEIKASYRKLAMKWHPDRNPDQPEAEKRFKEISEAYAVLSDPEKRARYDSGGFSSLEDIFGFGINMTNPFDLFRNVMNGFGGFGFGSTGSAARNQVYRGKDLKASVNLTLEEINTGVEKTLKVKRYVPCSNCGGGGVPPGAEVKTCQTCQGRGQVRKVSQFLLGHSIQIITCPDCGGKGKVATETCDICRGSGRVQEEETIPVKFPAGVKEGNYVVLEGKGDVGPNNGPPGSLLVFVHEKKHPLFMRREDNLLFQQGITFSQAALGDKIKIPTLNGKVELKIPKGTQSGEVFSFSNQGLPHLKGHGRGDLLVRTIVVTPEKLNPEEKKLLEKLKQVQGDKEPQLKGDYLEKIRDFFGI
ncbi:molecular chaperone DnaJ [bacterium]|nr:molecular chaperone DnaJ [bacterium]